MKTCSEMSDLIARLMDGQLPKTQAKELMAHLESCAACRAQCMLLMPTGWTHEANSGNAEVLTEEDKRAFSRLVEQGLQKNKRINRPNKKSIWGDSAIMGGVLGTAMGLVGAHQGPIMGGLALVGAKPQQETPESLGNDLSDFDRLSNEMDQVLDSPFDDLLIDEDSVHVHDLLREFNLEQSGGGEATPIFAETGQEELLLPGFENTENLPLTEEFLSLLDPNESDLLTGGPSEMTDPCDAPGNDHTLMSGFDEMPMN